MSDPAEKGKLTAEIGQDVIEAAVRSVESHEHPNEVAQSPDAELESVKAQLELAQQKGRELMAKLKEEHERHLRAAAELENAKKRAAREKEEIQKFGIERLLKDLLPVVDNLDRALEHSAAAADVASLREGVAMTRKLFEDTLGRHGVRALESLGAPFDPRFHEAMQQVEDGAVPPNQVVSEALKGYTLHDRLIRPALVVVSKAPTERGPPEAAEGQKPQ